MIGESLINWFFTTLTSAFSVLDFVGLDMSIIVKLQEIVCYGIWVVGADLMIVFATVVVGWWYAKLSVGLLLWIYELLPLI